MPSSIICEAHVDPVAVAAAVEEASAILFGRGPAAAVVVRALLVAAVVVGVSRKVLEAVAAVLLSRAGLFWHRRTSCLNPRGDGILAVVMEVDSRHILTMVVVGLCPDQILASIFVSYVVLRKSGRLVLRMPGFHVDSLLNMMMAMLRYQLVALVANAWEI